MHNHGEVDPLTLMADVCYQSKAIHLFPDGTGRIGGIVNNLFMIHEILLTLPILHLSRYIIRNKTQYYDAKLPHCQTC